MVSQERPRNVTVVGAGILGASIAWRLGRRGLNVTPNRQGSARSRRVEPQLRLD